MFFRFLSQSSEIGEVLYQRSNKEIYHGKRGNMESRNWKGVAGGIAEAGGQIWVGLCKHAFPNRASSANDGPGGLSPLGIDNPWVCGIPARSERSMDRQQVPRSVRRRWVPGCQIRTWVEERGLSCRIC